MSTVVAVQKDGLICMGADSLTVCGQQKELDGYHVRGSDKMLKVGDSYIGIVGDAAWVDVMRHYFQSNRPKLDSVAAIYEMALKLHSLLKEQYFLTPQSGSADVVEPSEYTMLIANKQGIFEIDWRRAVRRYQKFAAIGSGEQYALGAMLACYDFRTPEEIATKAVEVAAIFDLKTQIPVICKRISSSNST